MNDASLILLTKLQELFGKKLEIQNLDKVKISRTEGGTFLLQFFVGENDYYQLAMLEKGIRMDHIQDEKFETLWGFGVKVSVPISDFMTMNPSYAELQSGTVVKNGNVVNVYAIVKATSDIVNNGVLIAGVRNQYFPINAYHIASVFRANAGILLGSAWFKNNGDINLYFEGEIKKGESFYIQTEYQI